MVSSCNPKPREAWYAPFVGPSKVPSPLTEAHFLPLAPHPGNAAPPPPARPALEAPPAGWTRSFHAVPAAYPRQLREAHGTNSRLPQPFAIDGPEPKTSEERKARANAEAFKAAEARWLGLEWSMEEALKAAPKGMFVAVERWRRDVPRGGRTVVCTHANGMQKEHWQPVLREIIAREAGVPDFVYGTNTPLPFTPIMLADIWMFDDVNHGASVDLNAGLLGNAQIWDDTARDLLNFVRHVLPGAKAAAPSLPWQLSWHEDGAYPSVRVIGFGASFGGLAQVVAAHSAQDRFDGIFLADPMLPPRVRTWEQVLNEPESTILRVRGALKRRDRWPSREAARESMGAVAFYQAMDPRIFDLVISHGLVPILEGSEEVTLATPAWCEAAVFCEGIATARAWDKMPNICVPIAYFMAKSSVRTMGEETTREIMWRAPLSRNERSVTAEHLLVQEDPKATAECAGRFIATLQAGMWGSSEAEIRASYDEQPKARL